MKYKKIALTLLAAATIALPTIAQDGKTLFEENCTSCHKIGGGRLVGPDLKGVHEKRSEAWLVSFIQDSKAFIESGDADAKAIFDEFSGIPMPPQPFNEEEIKSIVAFIGTNGSADVAPEVASTDTEPEVDEDAEPEISSDDASEEDIDKGGKLFTGALAFENGGIACLSCHNVTNDNLIGGGRLAKDLTQVHGRMGDAGIKAMISSPPFPAMKTAYVDNSITEEEIYQLTAFLNSANKGAPYQSARSWDWVMVYGGGTLAFLFILYLAFVYGNRKKDSVKHDILKRQGYYDKN